MIIGRFIELKRETSQTPLDQIYMQHILRGTGVVEIFNQGCIPFNDAVSKPSLMLFVRVVLVLQVQMSAVERIYEASHSWCCCLWWFCLF